MEDWNNQFTMHREPCIDKVLFLMSSNANWILTRWERDLLLLLVKDLIHHAVVKELINIMDGE